MQFADGVSAMLAYNPRCKQDPFNNPNVNMDESLVNQLQGFSKLLEKEVRYRLTNETFEQIMKDISSSKNLYLTKINDSYEFHIIPLTHLEKPYEQINIEQGFDQIYYEDDEKERIKNISDDLFKIVKRQIKHYEAKITKLNASLDEALNLQADKDNGDLLYMYPNLNEKGLKQVEVTDYEGNKATIKTDPKLSVKENANRYYFIYQKKRKGKIYIEEQIDIATKELEYFNSLNEQLSIANYSDALDIKEELNKYGYLKKQVSKNKKKKKVNLYQLKIDDYTITFGKNNIQNDELTFRVAGELDTTAYAETGLAGEYLGIYAWGTNTNYTAASAGYRSSITEGGSWLEGSSQFFIESYNEISHKGTFSVQNTAGSLYPFMFKDGIILQAKDREKIISTYKYVYFQMQEGDTEDLYSLYGETFLGGKMLVVEVLREGQPYKSIVVDQDAQKVYTGVTFDFVSGSHVSDKDAVYDIKLGNNTLAKVGYYGSEGKAENRGFAKAVISECIKRGINKGVKEFSISAWEEKTRKLYSSFGKAQAIKKVFYKKDAV